MLDLFRRGEMEDCLNAARDFTGRWPSVLIGWSILCVCLQDTGDYRGAEQAGRQALQTDDNNADLHNILGAALKGQGKLQDAGFYFARAIELKPGFVDAYNNLGSVLVGLNRLDEAETLFRRALTLNPDSTLARCHLAELLRETDRTAEAQTEFETALDYQPDLTIARVGLGHVLTDQGKLAEAEQHYRAAIAKEPLNGGLHYHLSFVKRFSAGDPDLKAISSALSSTGLTSHDHIHLNYAAGKACDDVGENYDLAFEYYSHGARLRRAAVEYDIAREENDFLEVERFFTQAVFAGRTGSGHPSSRPIFIVGMPRSGTTLVEQILASHGGVHAVGERKDLSILCKSIDQSMTQRFPGWIDDLEPGDCEAHGEAYLDAISAGAPGTARITDKMLTNFKLLGFVALILPNARIVHVRRHPLDSCLSSFCQLFSKGSQFSYNLSELGRYYSAYARLMAHWQRVLPKGFLMTIDYEDVVERPEECARCLVEHCGLEWDANCLNFQETARPVKTASAAQVRQKLYSTSIGRWKNYKSHLGPLIDALGQLSQGY